MTEISRTAAVAANPAAIPPTPAEPATPTLGASFQINSIKCYVLVVTFSISNNINFLENIKQEEKTVSWNKYRPEITTQDTTI